MVSLKKYYLWFFLLCLGLTMLVGVLAALLPLGVGGILTAVPYLVAMVIVLYLFLNQQRRAPTQQERKQFALGFALIFWSYNIVGVLGGLWLFSRQTPEVWQNFLLYLKQPLFVILILIMILLLAAPLYLLSYWFYGPQAQRMAQHKFGN